MSAIVYLELEEIEEIHAQLLDLHGGLSGFRGAGGRGLVESALNRPRDKAYYAEADLLPQAASLLYGLAKNHGFLDGNKRIAFTACDVFLLENGWELCCDNATAVTFMLACGEASWTEEAVEAFVRKNAVEIKGR